VRPLLKARLSPQTKLSGEQYCTGRPILADWQIWVGTVAHCRTVHFTGYDFKGVRRLFMQIMVRDNNVDQALRALKKKLQREGVYREMKLRRHYEKPSEKRARERAAAIRRARKLERKRMEREGTAR
jgi:small subunit ribosomal protein S21